MRILAIDTSCDESCAAIVDTRVWKLVADEVHSHVDAMRKFGGVVPEIASREHLKGLPLAVSEALGKAGMTVADIDALAVTNRPGLIGALLVGVSFTKALAYSLGRPFSVLNHIEAHLFSPLLTTLEGTTAPPFPWVALVVSGGHTELFLVEGLFRYRWIGGTLDDAAGEAFDKIGKVLGMPYPAGPTIDRLAREEATPAHRTRFPFPRAKIDGLDFSFSGLKTAVALQVAKLGTLSDDDRMAVAASAQEAILDALIAKVTAASESHKARIVVTGGVACNSRFRERLPHAYFPQPRHCTDNAAMVALLAGLYAREGKLAPAGWEATAHAGMED